jgi:hypothetical protein
LRQEGELGRVRRQQIIEQLGLLAADDLHLAKALVDEFRLVAL